MTDDARNAQPDTSQMLKQVHQFGNTTESLFSRLYNSLTRRSQLQAMHAALSAAEQEANQLAVEKRRLQRLIETHTLEAERLRAVLANISEGIIMQDTAGRIVMMNQAAQALLGNQKNFWQSELGVLFSERRDMEMLGSELAPLGNAEQYEINERVLNVQIAGIADPDGQRIGTIMILRDITRDALAERMKNSFVTRISHELITPLAAMRPASEILLATPKDKAPNRRMLEIIGDNIDLLNRMVSEMIDLSRITSGDFKIQQDVVSLVKVLWDVVAEYEDDLHKAGLTNDVWLRDEPQLGVIGDEKYLRLALSALLHNAIIYNERGGSIIITAGLDPHDANRVAVSVMDSGVGISEKDLPNVFDLYYRGEPRTRAGTRLDPRGLGQGLYIARAIARAHGGYLYAESQVGEGSTFTLTLPHQQAAAMLPAADEIE